MTNKEIEIEIYFPVNKRITSKSMIINEGTTLKYLEDPIVLDPRLKDLGGRLIVNLEKLDRSLRELNLKSQDPIKYYELSLTQLKFLMYMKLFLIFIHIPLQAIVLFRVYKSFMNIKL